MLLPIAAAALAGWSSEPETPAESIRVTVKVLEGRDSWQGPTVVRVELMNLTAEELMVIGSSKLELENRNDGSIMTAGIDLRADETPAAPGYDYQLTMEPVGGQGTTYTLQRLTWTPLLAPARGPSTFQRAIAPGKYKLRLLYEISSINGPAFPAVVSSNKVKLDFSGGN